MFVFSNLATSIDGKIGVASRAHFMLGTKEDAAEMMRVRRESDAILMGASTIRAYKSPCLIRGEPAPACMAPAGWENLTSAPLARTSGRMSAVITTTTQTTTGSPVRSRVSD